MLGVHVRTEAAFARKPKFTVSNDPEASNPEWEERWVYSDRHPGFTGEIEFDLTIGFLGNTITRRAKVVYTYTPAWEYFDLRKKALYTGWESSSYSLGIAAVPKEHREDGTVTYGKPVWTRMEDLRRDDVIAHAMWESVIEVIDDKCKAEGVKRRKIAQAPRPPTTQHQKTLTRPEMHRRGSATGCA